jgi:copper chaperone
MPMSEHRFRVPGMSCEHCERAIRNELLKVNGVFDVDINLETKVVSIEHDPVVNTGAMREAIQVAGYEIEGRHSD